MVLSPRLAAAAEMIVPQRLTADIGTDHAFLPAYLVLNGICDKVLACDIGKKPLENAAATVERYGLSDRIELRISDGLGSLAAGEVSQIAICGMGGTLIADILDGAEWIRRDGFRLVLQPNTHTEDVRKWLTENGFSVDKEVCVRDAGRLYCCISACFTGRGAALPGYWYFGEISGADEPQRAYIKRQIAHVRTRFEAIEKAGRFPEEQALLKKVIGFYEENFNDDGTRRL